jgi:hypothetical protein
MQVPIVNALLYDAAQATILMSTLELVLGLRHVAAAAYHAHGTSSKPTVPRVFGFVAFALALTIAVGKLASMEVQWKLDYDNYEQYVHVSRAVIVLFFVLCLVFCLNAIFVLIQACRAPRAIETHQVRLPALPSPSMIPPFAALVCLTFSTDVYFPHRHLEPDTSAYAL